MTELRDLPICEEDGLPIPEVGPWALEKYRRVWYYDQIFSTGMKSKWDQRVYIDLFSGPGSQGSADPAGSWPPHRF